MAGNRLMSRRLWILPMLVAGLCAGFVALPAGPASASQTPTLSLDPAGGSEGTSFTASVSGFTPQEIVEFSFNGADTHQGCATDFTGACSNTIFVPPGVTAGPYTVGATGTAGDSATAVFHVTPTITLSPSSGPVGTVFTASPTDFGAGETVDISFNGVAQTSCVADSNGNCSAPVTVPNVPSGYDTVGAVGGASGATASASFQVTAGLSLQPSAGPSGSAFSASLSGFAPDELAEISFNGADDDASCATGTDGSCTVTGFVPAGVAGGGYTVGATGTSGDSAYADFTLTQTLSLAPSSGAVGSMFSASPGGFAAGETVAISFNGVAQTTCAADASGDCSANLTVPTGSSGNATVSAEGLASGDTATATFVVTPTIAGCPSPRFTSSAAATALAGTPFTFTVNTCTASVPKISAARLPKGLHLTDNRNGTATIAGTPAAKQSGPYTATITASVTTRSAPSILRPALIVSATQQFTVTVDSAPVFKSKAAYVDATGGAFQFPVTTAYGYPAPAFTETGLPLGVTLVDNGNGTAVIEAAGPVGNGGVYHVILTAGDSAGIPGLPPLTQSFTLTLYQGPAITSGASDIIGAGVGMTGFTVSDTGYPLPKLTAAGLPAGLRFTDNHNGTGTISGTPKPAAPALSTVTITAANRAASAVQSFGLQIDGKQHGYVAIAPTHDGHGYWLVNNDGDVSSLGDAAFLGSLTGLGYSNIVNAVTTPDGGGYWMVSASGGVFAFDDAHYYGSLNNQVTDVVSLTPTPDGGGYWLTEADGSVTAFGDATTHGSLSGVTDVIGLTSPDAGGYWLAEANGSVSAFGDASVQGSLSGVSNIVAMAAPDAGGYWLAGADGSVYGFGDAAPLGSVSGIDDIVDIAPTPDGQGYWQVGADGTVYSSGDAGFYGNG